MKIGFIGLGKMGSAMALNLIRAGHEVTVYNRSREKADPLLAAGGGLGQSPAEAAHDAEAVMSMLADDEAVTQVAAALPADVLHISCSTISTKLARDLATRGPYLSAPVFGRPEAAQAKKLIVVAAGSEDAIDRARPLFDAIGRATIIAGSEPWQANAVKLCGNFMIAGMLEAFGEAVATLRKAQVDPHVFLNAMNELFQSPVYKNYGQLIADGKFEPAGFALKLGLKDVRLALQTADECASPMPLASLLRDQLLDAVAHGESDNDWAAIAKTSARAAALD